LTDPTSHPEWISTVAFYKAVQLVEAVFDAQDGYSCHGHKTRNARVKENKYKAFHPHYRVLWSASTIARYLHDNESDANYSSFSDYMNPSDVQTIIVETRLYKLEQLALPMLDKEHRDNLKKVRIRMPEPANHLRVADSKDSSSSLT